MLEPLYLERNQDNSVVDVLFVVDVQFGYQVLLPAVSTIYYLLLL